LALACWCIGRVPAYAEFPKKARAWVVGVSIAALIGLAAFLWPESQHKLPWEPFSVTRLEQLAAEEKTVLVDFTADWCQTCKFLERTVLNTEDVKRVVTENKVETLVADWTDRDPEMGKILAALGSGEQVPVIAIFPAGKPREPIVLIGGYTKGKILQKLEQAGPSKTPTADESAVTAVAQTP
jgi:thiol:disulfide interchange protein